MGSPFPTTPTDTLDSHLLTQYLSLFGFSNNFLDPESDHRYWSHLIGPLASGLPIHVIPFYRLVRTPLLPNHTVYQAFPHSSVPIQWSQRLSGSHTLTVGTDFAAAATSLPQAAEAVINSLKLVSAVESPFYASEQTRYWQWTGVGRYSAHFGATARLPALKLSSLSPALTQVVPYVSSSFTAVATQALLKLSHASFRAHVRPLAGVGDRGLLTAEVLLSRGTDEIWAKLRLAYTHRLSESETEAETASISRVITEIERAAGTAHDVQNKVQSTAADIASPSLLQLLNNHINSTVQPISKLFNFVAPSIPRSAPPPRPLLPWSFPSYLSFGLSHSSPVLSLSDAFQPRSFRLTDHSSSWLSGLCLGVGFLARPVPHVTAQLECHASEQRLIANGRLWLRLSRRVEDDARLMGGAASNGVGNGMFVSGRVDVEHGQPQLSHVALTCGLSYMY